MSTYGLPVVYVPNINLISKILINDLILDINLVNRIIIWKVKKKNSIENNKLFE